MKFNGYSLTFIQNVSRKVIPQVNVLSFVDELDIICDDLKILADNYVEVADFTISNLLYNGKFFIGDPGSFVFNTDVSTRMIYRFNVRDLNVFVKDEIFGMVNVDKIRRARLENEFYVWDYIGEQIRDIAKPAESINQFVRRITRR